LFDQLPFTRVIPGWARFPKRQIWGDN